MRRILQFSVLVLALIGAGAAAAAAVPVTLKDLLAGGSITAGDKVFDRWTASFQDFQSSDANRSFNAANIEITPLADGGLDPGPGLLFTVLNDELTVTGDGGYSYLDFAFGFHVSVQQPLRGPQLAIKDNSLNMTGTLGNNQTNDLGMTILEWAGNGIVLDPSTTSGLISTELSYLANPDLPLVGPISTSVLSAASQFAPRGDVWITKDILVWATDQGETAALTSFTQRFSQQTVPEPGTLALLALAIVGVAASRRRTTV